MSTYCSSCGAANSINAEKCKDCSTLLFRPPENDPIIPEILESKSNSNGLPTGVLFSIVVAIVCAIYIINPTAGILEFLPDNIPIIGNLDEAAATSGLLYALSTLGLIPWTKKKPNA